MRTFVILWLLPRAATWSGVVLFASIAFGEKTAAVDGNVIRVCTRLAAVRGAGDATKNNSVRLF